MISLSYSHCLTTSLYADAIRIWYGKLIIIFSSQQSISSRLTRKILKSCTNCSFYRYYRKNVIVQMHFQQKSSLKNNSLSVCQLISHKRSYWKIGTVYPRKGSMQLQGKGGIHHGGGGRNCVLFLLVLYM